MGGDHIRHVESLHRSKKNRLMLTTAKGSEKREILWKICEFVRTGFLSREVAASFPLARKVWPSQSAESWSPRDASRHVVLLIPRGVHAPVAFLRVREWSRNLGNRELWNSGNREKLRIFSPNFRNFL